MALSVINHVLGRLRAIGVTDIFGVPGDYAFPLNDAIVKHEQVRWIGCCNELNAGYAADGYARIKGVGAICTTYGVGELSAINAIAGSYAEHLPVFHLVGMPNMATQSSRSLSHHTLGNGEFKLFHRMSEPVVCGSAIMTPQNVAYETERLIAEALYHRRTVYMGFPGDLANEPILNSAQPLVPPASDSVCLKAATQAIVTALAQARSACLLPGILVSRAGLKSSLQSLVDASGLPFATMFMDKSILEEQQSLYVGMYEGTLAEEKVRIFVESCDWVLMVGSLMTDFNSAAFTARLDPAKTISIQHHAVRVGGKSYPNIEMGDILISLAQTLTRRDDWPKIKPSSLSATMQGSGSDPISAASLYPRLSNFLRPQDILVAETGTCSMGLISAIMPKGATFHNQSLWGSIGWATPAAFGAAVAAPDRRVVLITGEGSHQLTAQEISQFGRLGLKPVIFVLNNSGYLIERLLCNDPDIAYNNVAPWRYTELPHALGCDHWFTAHATTCQELDQIMEAGAKANEGVYIEVITDSYAAPPLAMKLHDTKSSLYRSK